MCNIYTIRSGTLFVQTFYYSEFRVSLFVKHKKKLSNGNRRKGKKAIEKYERDYKNLNNKKKQQQQKQ